MNHRFILGVILLFPICGLCAQARSHPQKPFSKVELLALRVAGLHQDHMERDVTKRGIDFQLTEDYLNALKASGARDALIEALRKAPTPRSPRLEALSRPGRLPVLRLPALMLPCETVSPF